MAGFSRFSPFFGRRARPLTIRSDARICAREHADSELGTSGHKASDSHCELFNSFNCEARARATPAMADEPPRTPERPPRTPPGAPPPRAADPRELDGVAFERFASSGKRHKTCTTCKADRTLRKAAVTLRLLVNPKS